MSVNRVRVAIRADASTNIGLGHVKRCMALALALREAGAEVVLLARELGVATACMAHDARVGHLALPAPKTPYQAPDAAPYAAWAAVDWRCDAEQTIEILTNWKPGWVLVDHYSFDMRWHQQVADSLGVLIAVIDDLGDRRLSADLLIDHNFSNDHSQKYRGCLARESRLLGGPRFALLGPAYSNARPFVVAAEVRSIGIFMGGVDMADLSSVALRACREHAGFSGPIEIVVTRAFPHRQALVGLAAQWPDTSVVSDLPDLAEFFQRHDLQIGAGGGATWERCCIGVPTLALIAAANQQAVIPALAAIGALAIPDPPTSLDAKAVGDAIKSLLADSGRRRELGERSRALVDGRGATRVALSMCAASLTLRSATVNDAAMMYSWRNHPLTRRVSRETGEIFWVDHLEWLSRTLASEEHCLLVGRVGQIDIGVIRFDTTDNGESEVSLYLDPALHGLGLGRSLLLAGEKHLLAHYGTIRQFVATVLPGNEGSTRLFESSGYQFERGLWRKKTGSVGEN